LGWSKARVDAELPLSEAIAWQLLETIEPWGEARADYRAAVICWTIASCNYSGKGRRPQLKDFLKMFDFSIQKEQSDEEILTVFKKMTGKHEGKK
jgi:hypothetical protein